MTKRRTLLTAGMAQMLVGASLGAVEVPSKTEPPAEVRSALNGALLTGQGRLRYFGFSVYDASLWTAPAFRASRYAHHGLILELAYLRELKGRAIAERSLEEIRRAGPLTPTQAQDWLSAMLTAFPDVSAGDRITGLHTPGVGVRFWFNGQPRADIRDPEFSRLFFGIWLAESTSEPQLRGALLARAAP